MGLEKLKTKISVEDYLKGEEASEVRHEFIEGEVCSMFGTSDRHNRITANTFSKIDSHLANSRRETFIENVKLKVSQNIFYYPDVMVVCDEKPQSAYYREEPVLIVEVVSPSTEQTDRREKLRAYQLIPTVMEYVIVDQDKIKIEIHRRQPDGRWLTHYYNTGDMDVDIEFRSVEMTITLDEIYRRVKFDNRLAPEAE